MIGNKLHKWLFSLTLLISLVSFSGYIYEQVKPVYTITEVVTYKNTPPFAHHVSPAKQNLAPKLITNYSFNFKTFIQTKNKLYCQKEKDQNFLGFTLKDGFNTLHLKLVSATTTQDLLTFIG